MSSAFLPLRFEKGEAVPIIHDHAAIAVELRRIQAERKRQPDRHRDEQRNQATPYRMLASRAGEPLFRRLAMGTRRPD